MKLIFDKHILVVTSFILADDIKVIVQRLNCVLGLFGGAGLFMHSIQENVLELFQNFL